MPRNGGLIIGLMVIALVLLALVAFALDSGHRQGDPVPGHAVGLAVVVPEVITQAPERVFSPEIIASGTPVSPGQAFRIALRLYIALGGVDVPDSINIYGLDPYLSPADVRFCGHMQDAMGQDSFRGTGVQQRLVDEAATLANDACGDT